MSAGAIRAGRAYVELSLVDKMTSALSGAETSLQRFSTKSGQMFAQASAGALAIGAPLLHATNMYANFDDQMRLTAAVTGATGKTFENLTELAIELGKTTSFTSSQVASAMVVLGRAGLTARQITNSISGVLALARSTGSDLATSARIATQAMYGFKLEASSLSAVSDILTAAVNNSNSTLDDLEASFKHIAPLANEFGVSIKDSAFAIGVLANAGLRGERGATALRNVLLRMTQTPVKRQYQDLGVQLTDELGNYRNLRDILRDLRDATAGMDDANRSTIFYKLFGMRGFGGNRLTESIDEFERLNDALENSAGVAKRIMNEMDAGLGGTKRMLLSALEYVEIRVGQNMNAWQSWGEMATDTLRDVGDFAQQHKGITNWAASSTLALGTFAAAMGVLKLSTLALTPAMSAVQGTGKWFGSTTRRGEAAWNYAAANGGWWKATKQSAVMMPWTREKMREEYQYMRDENGHKIIGANGSPITVRENRMQTAEKKMNESLTALAAKRDKMMGKSPLAAHIAYAKGLREILSSSDAQSLQSMDEKRYNQFVGRIGSDNLGTMGTFGMMPNSGMKPSGAGLQHWSISDIYAQNKAKAYEQYKKDVEARQKAVGRAEKNVRSASSSPALKAAIAKRGTLMSSYEKWYDEQEKKIQDKRSAKQDKYNAAEAEYKRLQGLRTDKWNEVYPDIAKKQEQRDAAIATATMQAKTMQLSPEEVNKQLAANRASYRNQSKRGIGALVKAQKALETSRSNNRPSLVEEATRATQNLESLRRMYAAKQTQIAQQYSRTVNALDAQRSAGVIVDNDYAVARQEAERRRANALNGQHVQLLQAEEKEIRANGAVTNAKLAVERNEQAVVKSRDEFFAQQKVRWSQSIANEDAIRQRGATPILTQEEANAKIDRVNQSYNNWETKKLAKWMRLGQAESDAKSNVDTLKKTWSEYGSPKFVRDSELKGTLLGELANKRADQYGMFGTFGAITDSKGAKNREKANEENEKKIAALTIDRNSKVISSIQEAKAASQALKQSVENTTGVRYKAYEDAQKKVNSMAKTIVSSGGLTVGDERRATMTQAIVARNKAALSAGVVLPRSVSTLTADQLVNRTAQETYVGQMKRLSTLIATDNAAPSGEENSVKEQRQKEMRRLARSSTRIGEVWGYGTPENIQKMAKEKTFSEGLAGAKEEARAEAKANQPPSALMSSMQKATGLFKNFTTGIMGCIMSMGQMAIAGALIAGAIYGIKALVNWIYGDQEGQKRRAEAKANRATEKADKEFNRYSELQGLEQYNSQVEQGRASKDDKLKAQATIAKLASRGYDTTGMEIDASGKVTGLEGRVDEQRMANAQAQVDSAEAKLSAAKLQRVSGHVTAWKNAGRTDFKHSGFNEEGEAIFDVTAGSTAIDGFNGQKFTLAEIREMFGSDKVSGKGDWWGNVDFDSELTNIGVKELTAALTQKKGILKSLNKEATKAAFRANTKEIARAFGMELNEDKPGGLFDWSAMSADGQPIAPEAMFARITDYDATKKEAERLLEDADAWASQVEDLRNGRVSSKQAVQNLRDNKKYGELTKGKTDEEALADYLEFFEIQADEKEARYESAVKRLQEIALDEARKVTTSPEDYEKYVTDVRKERWRNEQEGIGRAAVDAREPLRATLEGQMKAYGRLKETMVDMDENSSEYGQAKYQLDKLSESITRLKDASHEATTYGIERWLKSMKEENETRNMTEAGKVAYEYEKNKKELLAQYTAGDITDKEYEKYSAEMAGVYEERSKYAKSKDNKQIEDIQAEREKEKTDLNLQGQRLDHKIGLMEQFVKDPVGIVKWAEGNVAKQQEHQKKLFAQWVAEAKKAEEDGIVNDEEQKEIDRRKKVYGQSKEMTASRVEILSQARQMAKEYAHAGKFAYGQFVGGFSRNIGAQRGGNDPVLKELEKQTKELKEIRKSNQKQEDVYS